MNRLFRRWEIKKLHIMRFRIPKMNARKNVTHKILLAKMACITYLWYYNTINYGIKM